ncbi:hypothetical protein [Escherichia coli]|nr:hypothetical protein [Escherichia coli]
MISKFDQAAVKNTRNQRNATRYFGVTYGIPVNSKLSPKRKGA